MRDIAFISLPESSLPDVWQWEMDNAWNGNWVEFADWKALVWNEHWQHWGVMKKGQFVACISFEHQGEGIVEMHVQTRQRAHKDESLVGRLIDAPEEKLSKEELIHVCRALGESVLDMGMKTLVALIPDKHRPLMDLAMRCGMRPMSYAATEKGLIYKFEIHHVNSLKEQEIHGRR